ncbi:MAG: hypothetical protein ACRDJ9_31310, partial [Dehalococcoidia bacterium]
SEALGHPGKPVRPSMLSGRDFFTARHLDLAALAARQRVQPVTHFEDLLGDFWPDDETAEEFIAAVHGWRRGR